MEEADHAVLTSNLLQDAHGEHLVIAGKVGRLEERCKLELGRSHLVVTRLGRNAELVQSLLRIRHERLHPVGNRAKVMVIELVPLRRIGPKERSAAEHEVRPPGPGVLVHQEVLLLAPERGGHAMHAFGGAEGLQDAHGVGIESLDGAKERRLLVERFTRPGNEYGWNAERRLATIDGDERGAGWIPMPCSHALRRCRGCSRSGRSSHRARPG